MRARFNCSGKSGTQLLRARSTGGACRRIGIGSAIVREPIATPPNAAAGVGPRARKEIDYEQDCEQNDGQTYGGEEAYGCESATLWSVSWITRRVFLRPEDFQSLVFPS